MHKFHNIEDKVYRKLHWFYFAKCKMQGKAIWLYPSYRHYKKKLKQNNISEECDKEHMYLTQQPNQGAGIGHQIANWISGYWFSTVFGVKYAYSSFSSASWDAYLGFSEGEIRANDLCNKGYKKVRLPYFKEKSIQDLQLIQNIIDSYSGERVIFYNELDQLYQEQYGVAESIREKFNSAEARKKEKCMWNGNNINIAIHIRRGDIVAGQASKAQELTKRWLDDEYYINILDRLLNKITTDKKISLYLFSQGREEDFSKFTRYKNIQFCLDMSAQDTFLHLVRADILLTSKSSFSYKPALLSDGIRICPKDFWHGYPQNEQWILVDDEGNIGEDDIKDIIELLNKRSR